MFFYVSRTRKNIFIWFLLSQLWTEFDRCADGEPFMPTYQMSNEKAKSLGIEYTPLEVSLKETVESLKEKQLLVSKSH